MAGKQVKLFLVDGTPGGITTAEITNWTGHVVSGPRSKLADLMTREETKRTGAYLLLGDHPTAVGETRCYIGEADEIRTRLKEHAGNRGKDFWNRVVIITSKDANLTKAHGRYLEARLISLAVAAGRSHVENGTNPPTPSLPEADVSDMDYFVDQLKIVLPVLGINDASSMNLRSRLWRRSSHPSSDSLFRREESPPARFRSTGSSRFSRVRWEQARSDPATSPRPHRTPTEHSAQFRRSSWRTGRCESTVPTRCSPEMSCSPHLRPRVPS